MNYQIFKGLFDIWKNRNYDLHFYFQEIFEKAVVAATERAQIDGIQLINGAAPKYKSLFAPVGFSIENVAIIAAVLKPNYLRVALTESSRKFHRKNLHLVEDYIMKSVPGINTTEVTITSDDQKLTEQKIVEWVEEMKVGYGLSYGQMAIDLTGGTKPMSIGANNAALSFNEIDAFYLRTEYDEDTEEPIPGTETLMPLNKYQAQIDKNLIFVIMPFAPEFNQVYQWIEEAVKASGLKCLRADKEIFSGGIMDRVRDNIIKACAVIADLSGANLNVYYELGLSHGHAKKVIMLTQKIDDLPFDLRHLRMVVYKLNDKTEFIKQILPEIEHMQ